MRQTVIICEAFLWTFLTFRVGKAGAFSLNVRQKQWKMLFDDAAAFISAVSVQRTICMQEHSPDCWIVIWTPMDEDWVSNTDMKLLSEED